MKLIFEDTQEMDKKTMELMKERTKRDTVIILVGNDKNQVSNPYLKKKRDNKK